MHRISDFRRDITHQKKIYKIGIPVQQKKLKLKY